MNQQFKWLKQRPTKGLAFPTSREGATLTYIPKYQSVVLFGGICNGRLNEIMIFDIQKDEWKVQQTQGRQPSPRCYHSGFYDESQNVIYYYGGQADKGRSLTDFYCLSFQNFVWKRLFLLESPPNRHNHTMCDLPGMEKIIFGGACLPEDLMYNDVWIFNYSAIQFTNQQEIPGAVATKKNCKGEHPAPRQGHGAVVYQNNMFVFGGKCSDETTQLYKLSLDNYQWKRILHLGKAPGTRAFFSTSLIKDNVIIFGGIDNVANKVLNETYLLNLTDYHWSSPFTAGPIPSPRYSHCSCQIEDIILIMGGIEQTYCSMDMYFLSQGSINQNAEWEQLKEPTELEKQTNDAANQIIMEGKMYLNQIEEAMMKERQKITDLQKEVQNLQEEADNLDTHIKKQTAIVMGEHQKASQNNKNKEIAIETIFLMIKQEQTLTKQLNYKCQQLEECIQNSYPLLHTLDQFYQSIRQIQGSDPADLKVKKMADQFANDIQKAKEAQLESLSNIYAVYQKFTALSNRNEVELNQWRDNVKDMNNDFEQLIFETEHD
ncbi:unnamed protein product (macronuclear) [Paramecium tetraurelia]|uniref:Kelch motif family protein n=1 Tax=Paramecium tetraurelia TaxID=5888 RepID=A0BE42_PARTE|nr:uncharacterized protein GSPATT00027841001 [Paramecium tetraurelia]CAK56809.1 unnamed protein product [Paramecium tetraurelia]|eukprot:XP_001424207.1 hypothetical protein (macronuclear) [Paramecium tetraurelia strain d4-2]